MNGEFFRQTDYRDLSDTFGPACQEADRILLSAGLAQVTRHPDRRNSQSPSKSRLVTINASSVKPRNIDFLWPGGLPGASTLVSQVKAAWVRASYSSM